MLWMEESPPKVSCSSLQRVPEVESSEWLPGLVNGEIRCPAPHSVFVQCECATGLTRDEAVRLLVEAKSQPQLHLIFPYAAGMAACADVPTTAGAAGRPGDGAGLAGTQCREASPRRRPALEGFWSFH